MPGQSGVRPGTPLGPDVQIVGQERSTGVGGRYWSHCPSLSSMRRPMSSRVDALITRLHFCSRIEGACR
jgi:hypothetical protein